MSTIHLLSPTGTQSQHDENQFRAMWEQGVLTPGSQYWMEGMSEWRPVTEHFQAHVSATPLPPATPAPRHAYTKNPKSLTSFLLLMLWLSLGAELLLMVGEISQLSLISGSYTEAEGAANDTRQQIFGLVYLAIYIVTGIVFLRWIHRANLNCRGFGAQDMKFTPGWSIGYFFIPFLNLVRPYQAMREIWQISHRADDWQSNSVSSLVGWWWALWIISNIMGNIASSTSMDANTIEKLQTSGNIAIASNIVGVILCLLAITLIKSISRMQERLVNHGPQELAAEA